MVQPEMPTGGVSAGSAPNGGFAGTGNSFAGASGSNNATAGIGGGAGIAGTAGTGDPGAAGSVGTAGTGAGMSGYASMTFDVLTHSLGGRFAPNNVGAIWIETSGGQFVKTLEVWAFIRVVYLTKYNAEAGGSRVDAVSSATLANHRAHHVTWNLKDANGAAVPDGAYKMIVEVTDADATGKFVSVDFMKAPGVAPLTPADNPYFTGMQLAFH
jgi:hypothetical protein